jgi:glutathione S-transferase
VDLTTKRTASGTDYTRISAKGYGPALQLDSGENYRSLFNPATSDLVREERLANLNKRHALIEEHLARHPHWSANSFSVATLTSFLVTTLAEYVTLDLSRSRIYSPSRSASPHARRCRWH